MIFYFFIFCFQIKATILIQILKSEVYFILKLIQARFFFHSKNDKKNEKKNIFDSSRIRTHGLMVQKTRALALAATRLNPTTRLSNLIFELQIYSYNLFEITIPDHSSLILFFM